MLSFPPMLMSGIQSGAVGCVPGKKLFLFGAFRKASGPLTPICLRALPQPLAFAACRMNSEGWVEIDGEGMEACRRFFLSVTWAGGGLNSCSI